MYTRESANLPAFSLSTVPPVPRNKLSSSSMVKRGQRAPPTFNLLVCGAQHTGKTSFLQTLLGTVKLNPHQPSFTEAKQRLDKFGGSSKRRTKTKELTTCSVEILERGERVGLTVIDTPGLPIRSDGKCGPDLNS
jgi:septin family protein